VLFGFLPTPGDATLSTRKRNAPRANFLQEKLARKLACPDRNKAIAEGITGSSKQQNDWWEAALEQRAQCFIEGA
jgi:hypothetical protein